MANPQIENGFTPIANEIMEALTKISLSGQEFRLILHLLRNTYGFHKKEYYLPLTKISKLMGCNKNNASRLINKLVLSKMITVIKNDNGKPRSYCFNKDYDLWDKGVIKNDNVIKNDRENIKNDNPPLSKMITLSIKNDNPFGSKRATGKRLRTPKDIFKDNIKDNFKDNKDILSSSNSKIIPYDLIIDYLNKRTQSQYRISSKKTRSLIHARWVEGYRLDDFKYVIDVKVQNWGKDEKMKAFLRPETLFGTKFESYRNEKPKMKQPALYKFLKEKGAI